MEYRPTPLAGRTVCLPHLVKVQNGRSGQVLRSARLMDFRLVDLDAEKVWRTARQFAGLAPQYRQYLDLCSRYFEDDRVRVRPEDVDLVRHLLAYFGKGASTSGVSSGEMLKWLSGLIRLNLLIGDDEAVAQYYRRYLATLTDSGLSSMVLEGGAEPIERLMLRCRYAMASRLLKHWVQTSTAIGGDEAVLSYAVYGLKKQRLSSTAALIDGLLKKGGLAAETRFRAQALRCGALHHLIKLIDGPDAEEQPQAQWALSLTTKASLRTLLSSAIGEAQRSFRELNVVTQQQAQQPSYDNPLLRRRRGLPDPSPVQEAWVYLNQAVREQDPAMDSAAVSPRVGQDSSRPPSSPGSANRGSVGQRRRRGPSR